MNRLLVAAMIALPLAACSKGPTVVATNASTEEVANQVAATGALTINPGRWEGTTKIVDMKMPGLPAAQQQMMGSEIGKATKVVSCIKPEDIKDKRGFFKGMDDDKSCTYPHFVMSGGTLDATMACNKGGATSNATMKGTFSGDTMHMDVSMDTKDPRGGPAGQVSMKMTMDSKRVGACTGTEDRE